MTKKRYIAKLGVLLAVFLSLAVFAVAADLKVEVMVRSANVRLKPELDSPVVGNAVMGAILLAEKKTGEWYLVELPADASHPAIRGYVHESVVREVAAKTPASKPAPVVAPKLAPARSVKPMPAKKARAGSGTARKKFYARLGAGYGSKSFDYSRSWAFAMYGESGTATESYAVDASGVSFDVGLGFMFTPAFGVELSFTPASGKSNGTFAAGFPHPFYYDLPREKEWTDDGLKYSASELNLDALYAFSVSRRIKLYVCAGGTYFMGVKIENLQSIEYDETTYPYFDLDITPQYASYSASAFGFNAGGGLDYQLSSRLAINLNARYASGSAKIKIEESEVKIPTGGIRATVGIKIGF